jgi:hypothetical protein
MKPSAEPWVSSTLVVMLIGFYAGSAFSQTSSAKGAIQVHNAQLTKAQAALAKHEAMLMNIPGVVGVGLGMTDAGDHVAIHVHLNVQATGDTIPRAIPNHLDRVPVRVIKSDEMRPR